MFAFRLGRRWGEDFNHGWCHRDCPCSHVRDLRPRRERYTAVWLGTCWCVGREMTRETGERAGRYVGGHRTTRPPKTPLLSRHTTIGAVDLVFCVQTFWIRCWCLLALSWSWDDRRFSQGGRGVEDQDQTWLLPATWGLGGVPWCFPATWGYVQGGCRGVFSFELETYLPAPCVPRPWIFQPSTAVSVAMYPMRMSCLLSPAGWPEAAVVLRPAVSLAE